MVIHIKSMVCNRCISAVQALLTELEYRHFQVGMGWVSLEAEELPAEQKQVLMNRLSDLGFEWIDDRKSRIIETIKNLIIQKVQNESLAQLRFNWSQLIAEALNHEYKYLSTLFSSVEGITIEHFIILQKIEKAKELIVYDELSLSEIADRLGYSSVAHLSNQFKKTTGLPPGKFRELGLPRRKPLDLVN
ncbi:MAG: AraC family transcriptional regulator [Bacteroidetes bacterium]|nr:AraC family transcriptional regulator [Bacteroidota bacterium]MBL0018060.1 AraC family transcriptional regulator [Bacteroidota bacterium]MBP6639825.1 AraC family transcriptional regulator [Bacteroidia bacterium]MBP6721612.1 AraC family transcriptional regulator [Bacteroidia bacterium]